MKIKLSKKDLKQLQEVMPQSNVTLFKNNMEVARNHPSMKAVKVKGLSIPDIFKKLAFITDIMNAIKKNILEPLKIPMTYFNMILAILEEIQRFNPNVGFSVSDHILTDKKGNEYRLLFAFDKNKI